MIIDPGSPDLALERVELAFPELLPGFQVVERRVRFDGREVADLLATAAGRTLLVSLVGEDEDAAALRGLDGLSFARTQRGLLASYLGIEEPLESSPEVVLVAASFSTRLRARLAALGSAGDFWLVTRHELSTARGSSTRLEIVGSAETRERLPEQELPEWATDPPTRDFLACIAPDRLALGLEVLARLRRLDPELSWHGEEASRLACTWRGSPICALEWIDGHLELQLGEGSTPHALRDLDAVEFVLDWVLTAFLEVAGAEGPAPAGSGGKAPEVETTAIDLERPAPAPQREIALDPQPDLPPPYGSEELAPLPEEHELPAAELGPLSPGPLLSQEELEAFRE